MRLRELLTEGRILVPLQVSSMGEGLLRLLPPEATAGWEASAGDALLKRLRAGEGGVMRRPSDQTVVLSLRGSEADQPWAALGVATEPLDGREEEGREGPRALLVVRLPTGSGFGTGAIQGLVSMLRDIDVHSELLEAQSADDVRGISPLMELDLTEPLRVEHILTPLKFRVFPDTPLEEVVELMARRELRSLPVVDEDLRVLGMVTAGEALRYAVEQVARGQTHDERPSSETARDVMSRAVMCVSEDQDLLDAAQVMANRDVSQLPVVREGEIVGMLTRDAVLKAVLGAR